MSSSASSTVPRHATHRYYTVLLAVGLVLLSIGGSGVFLLVSTGNTSGLVAPALVLAFGATFAFLGWVGRKAAAGVQLVNTSFDLIARGRLADAEKLLDEADKKNNTSLIRSVSAVQRGLIAMRRGDPKTGLAHLDQAIATKPGLLYRQSVRVQMVNALGIRAFLRAVNGDRDGARADAETLRQSPDALSQALARAALAEAICIEKEGDRDALRKHLATHHDLLFDVTDRRERAIVRAFQRMLESTATSVYRKGAKLDLHGDDPPLVDWIAQIVPAAAPFVEAPRPQNSMNELPAAVASNEAQQAVTNARKSAQQKVKGEQRGDTFARVTIVVLIAMLLGAWKLLTSVPNVDQGDGITPPTWDWKDNLALLGGAYLAILGASIGRRVWRAMQAKRETRELFAAMNLSAQGKLEDAKTNLTKLAASRFAFVKAQAHLALAYIAERRTDLTAALDHCDQGIASLSRYILRISASDILLPDLMSQRAFVLAAMDRHDEAEAELAALPPAYPYRSRSLVRVRLVSLARRGDLEGAAKLASETNLDLPLTARDELLADTVCAAIKPESRGAGELPRIRRELRTVSSLRPWLAAVAPKALDALEHATEDERALATQTPADRAAEEEALAEAEAARDEAAMKREVRTI